MSLTRVFQILFSGGGGGGGGVCVSVCVGGGGGGGGTSQWRGMQNFVGNFGVILFIYWWESEEE